MQCRGTQPYMLTAQILVYSTISRWVETFWREINACPIPTAQAADERVLLFLQQQNRPYNAQGVTDHLAQFGVKKAQAQKALDTLSESGKINCKVGKSTYHRIYRACMYRGCPSAWSVTGAPYARRNLGRQRSTQLYRKQMMICQRR